MTSYFPESFSENPAWIDCATFELQSDPSQECPRGIRRGELEIYRLSTRWPKHRLAVSQGSKHVAHAPDGPVTSPNGREREQNSGWRASDWDFALRRPERGERSRGRRVAPGVAVRACPKTCVGTLHNKPCPRPEPKRCCEIWCLNNILGP